MKKIIKKSLPKAVDKHFHLIFKKAIWETHNNKQNNRPSKKQPSFGDTSSSPKANIRIAVILGRPYNMGDHLCFLPCGQLMGPPGALSPGGPKWHIPCL